MVFEDLTPVENALKTGDISALEALRRGGQTARFRPPFIRSALMLSAHKIRHLNKLDNLEADMVVLNLEDGVAPALKPLALRLCGLFLSALKSVRSYTVVRINPLKEGGEEEIAYLNAVAPDAIRIPKIRSPREVERALALIDGQIKVHLSIETVGAWRHLAQLRPDMRVEAFYLGALDLLADMALPQRVLTPGNPTHDYLLARFLTESAGVGVLPVSYVYQRHEDMAGFRARCEAERAMGYHAKGCISPKQVSVANTLFAPDAEELARARAVVALFESNPDRSDFVHPCYGFVDEPVYKGALRLLEAFQ